MPSAFFGSPPPAQPLADKQRIATIRDPVKSWGERVDACLTLMCDRNIPPTNQGVKDLLALLYPTRITPPPREVIEVTLDVLLIRRETVPDTV